METGSSRGGALRPVSTLLLVAALLPASASAQEDPEGGAVSPERADAIRDTLTRPSAEQPFTVGDALSVPFDVLGFPFRLAGRAVAEATGWLASPPRRDAAVGTYRRIRRAGFRPSLSSDLGSRSGPAVELAWVGLEPLRLESAASVKGYQRHRVSLASSSEGVDVAVAAGFRRYLQEWFWGVGLDTPESQRSDYALEEWSVDASAGWPFARSWRLTLGAGWEERTVGRGRDDDTPDLRERFGPATLPGFGRTRFAVVRGGLELDDRRRVELWTAGLRGRVEGRAYRGLRGTDVDFASLHADVAFFLPFSRLRHLTLRGRGTTLVGGRGRTPFTHLPHLGGAETLRGYDWGRFRDRTVLSASVEWRWELWRELRQRGRVHGLLFLDYGTAGSAPDEVAGTRGALGLGLGGRWRASVVEGWVAVGEDGTRVSASIHSAPW